MNKTSISNRTLSHRPELGPQLPLKQPHVILVDPSSACNLRCKFCPTGDPYLIESTKRYQGQLSLVHFNKLIADINDFPEPLSILRLYKEGEPLLNRNFSKFVRIAKKSNIQRVDTTTNGLLLSHKVSEDLIDSGIDQINISLNGLTSIHYLEYTQRNVDAEKLIEEITYLCDISGSTTVYVKCIKDHLSQSEQDLFYYTFNGKADKVFLENLQPNWPLYNFDYIKPAYQAGHYGQTLAQRQVCPFIFYMMVVNSDGSISPCVQDWNHQLIIGDINTSTLLDIWNNTNFNRLRSNHLNSKRHCHANCHECPVLLHGCLDNIDEYAEILLPYYQ